MFSKKQRLLSHGIAGLQHVFVSNVWLDPIYVAAAAGLSLNMSVNLVNTIFIVSGIVTLTQVTKLVRLPIIQGPSAAFDALMIGAGKSGQLAAASGSILISALLVFLLSITGLMSKILKFLTPTIIGTLIFLVGVSLSSFTLSEFLGGYPGDKGFAAPQTLLLAIVTTGIVLGLSLFARGYLKRFAFLIALVIGDGLAIFLGQMNFSLLATKPWFGLPHLLPYGQLRFNWVVFSAFFVAYLVAVVEAVGVYEAAGAAMGETIAPKRVQNGLLGEAVGSMFSSLFGGFPTTAYAQNVGVLNLSQNTSHMPVLFAGTAFIIFGFVPKIGALLALTPSPVIGGIFLPAATTLLMTGLKMLNQADNTQTNQIISGLSIVLAIALPAYASGWHGVLGQLLSNTILIGAIAAISLHIGLNLIPKYLRKVQQTNDPAKK